MNNHTAKQKHHKLSPSKFDAWLACPCFESNAPGPEAERGSIMHAAFARVLQGDLNALETIPQGDREEIQWAADTVKALAREDRIETEITMSFRDDVDLTTQIFFGTADVLIRRSDGTAIIADLKTGEIREHRAQLAAYALAYMDLDFACHKATCYALFSRYRKKIECSFTREEAKAIAEGAIAARSNEDRQPSPCDYCGFCADKLTCPALVNRAVVVAENREDWKGELPAQWHPSNIIDPVQMSRALNLARFVGDWADSVRHHATELAKTGVSIPGWKIQERRGRREVTDLATAFERMASDVPQPEFLACCSLSLPKLADTYATKAATPKAKAAREIETRLADVISEGKPSVSLVREKEGHNEN